MFLGCMFVIAPAAKVVPFFTYLFTNFLGGFNYKEYMLSRCNDKTLTNCNNSPSPSPTTSGSGFLISTSTDNTILESPLAVLAVQVVATWLAYIFAKFACKYVETTAFKIGA